MSIMDELTDDVLQGVAQALQAWAAGGRMSELDACIRHHVRTFLILSSAKEGKTNEANGVAPQDTPT
jgi:hypothetical protein